MFEVIKREMTVPNLHEITLLSPDIAQQILPGQFVIVRSDEEAERIPLSVADWDRKAGTITLIFMEVGASTEKLAALKQGDKIPTVVGPLGKATEIKKFGTVVCIGGCFGIGSIYPAVKALKEKGNSIIMIAEARTGYLLYWEDKIQPYCEKYISITRDGSYGLKGTISDSVSFFKKNNIKPDHFLVNGCTHLVYSATKTFSEYDVPIIVALNSIMIDGTGMCGVCRLTADGKMKFACVDGPEFDGRTVDWEELFKRRKQYIDEEAFLVHDSGCKRSI